MKAVVVVNAWYLELQLPLQSVPITTNVVSSNPAQSRCIRYNIMWWSVSVTCDRSVIFSGTPVSSTNKTDSHDIPKILLKVALNTITLIPPTPLIIMEGYVLSAWHVHVVKSPLITCLLIFYFTEGYIKKRDSEVFLKFSMLSDILLMMVISVVILQ